MSLLIFYVLYSGEVNKMYPEFPGISRVIFCMLYLGTYDLLESTRKLGVKKVY